METLWCIGCPILCTPGPAVKPLRSHFRVTPLTEMESKKRPLKTLERVLSKAGIGSRVETRGWVHAGRVKVNGRVTRNPEQWIDMPRDRVRLDNAPLVARERIYRLLELSDGPTRPATVTRVRDSAKYTHFEITLTEGRNRQVRRMVEALGARVLELVRLKIGPIAIGSLAIGTWRLTRADIEAFR
jgi:16S rRNA U516 pseudouridylate synthase RsuA-like enzyme